MRGLSARPRWRLHAALGALATAMVACVQEPTALRTDVQTYMKRMASWGPIEAETARTLERILATEFVDEAEVGHQIADSRPRIQAHLAQVRAVTPKTDAVRHVHTLYLDAWDRLLRGYDAIEKGFATAEYSNLAQGREAMGAWRDGIMAVARELRELARRVGVDPGAMLESAWLSSPSSRVQST